MKKHDNAYKWLALFVVLIGTFMSVLSSSLINLALPKMMSVFGVTLSGITWVVTAYTLAMGAVVPLTGFLSDTIGIKKLYMIALSMFTLGSALSGMSWSLSAMVMFRVVQAIGGGLMSPVGMSIVYAIFPVEERGRALGLWGVAALAAPALGPTLGGYILSHLDWRLLFYINVPIGIFGVIFAAFLLKETEKKPFEGNFDMIGFVTSVMGIVCTLYVLGKWSTINWQEAHYPILLTIGIFSLILFVVNELTHTNPLLDLRIFKLYDYALSQIISCVLVLALMGGSYILPLYLQNAKGLSAMQSGLIMLPSALSAAITMPISGALFDKFGAKVVSIPGLFILLWGSYHLTYLSADTANSTIMLVSFIRGFGLGLAMMPINTVGMNAVPLHLTGRASALTNTVKNIFSSISVTIVATLMTTATNNNYARLSEDMTLSNQAVADTIKQMQGLYMTSGMSSADAQASAMSSIAGLLQKQAYLDAVNYTIAFTVIAILITIFLAFMMKARKQKEIYKA
ncbi:DHA2 family efflux MFS transporter permease subunit [Aminipila luticellarii]|uniref:DHA2 family efflux MFS transporter permease subunit n=1 Tax=Aminipila luticellarii TaxID=2507160 RepID=A0A410PWR2_9FIRM|nr:DHA2 family efflux MFS transporter permease subunit [Aminipila luticellarii]QAT43379.1 DHA2 family efflux MFS transporter permease subunit [Aminipila luticellarii]